MTVYCIACTAPLSLEGRCCCYRRFIDVREAQRWRKTKRKVARRKKT